MPQSLSSTLIHLVFSTKNREAFITPTIETELHPYMAKIFRELKSPSLAIDGTNDHRRITFQDEYRKFLKSYGIEYDERYVWD
jgi:hypothetical protein